jgi:hypothetical protein
MTVCGLTIAIASGACRRSRNERVATSDSLTLMNREPYVQLMTSQNVTQFLLFSVREWEGQLVINPASNVGNVEICGHLLAKQSRLIYGRGGKG